MDKTIISYSIIIPHYNIPKLLQRCLNSIPERASLQIIVVDDHSDSAVVDFVHFPGLERKNVECVFLQEKQGAGHARNVGMRYARGKWLLFADADDFFHKDFYDIILSYEDSPYEVVYFDSYSVFSDTLVRTYNREDIFQQYIETEDKNILRFMSHSVWGKMFLRDFIVEKNIFCDETPASNDVLFSGLVGLYAKKIRVDKRILYCCTVRSGSICTRINISNIEARIFVASKFNLILKRKSVDVKYWMNLIGPIVSLIKVKKGRGYALLLHYFLHTPLIRIYYDLCQSGNRFIKRFFGMNRDKDMRKLQKEI